MSGSGTVAEALAQAARRLREAGVPEAPRDARRLAVRALGVSAERLALVLAEPIGSQEASWLRAAVARRCAREPLSHILGLRAFWGRDFEVTRDVLDPRPETESLVALALEAPFERVLDLGTGSGCILLTLLAERPAANGVGIDISEAALAVAERNAVVLRVAERTRLMPSDWFDAVEGEFDLVVSNPPYVSAAEMAGLAPELAHEPALALCPGGDGLDSYRAIAARAIDHLAPGGRLLLEIGPEQGAAVSAMLKTAGLVSVVVYSDLDGRDRVVGARKSADPEGKGA